MQNISTVQGTELQGTELSQFFMEVDQPLLIKGLVKDWPLVQAAQESDRALYNYLSEHMQDQTVTACIGSKETGGRIFYNQDMSGFNFETQKITLSDFFKQLQDAGNEQLPPLLYIGSRSVEQYFPSLRSENDIHLKHPDITVRYWLGNQTRIAAHYDIPANIACVAAGKRRFTLFPPEQIANLYPGPVEFNPAGQAISMVDFLALDLDKFPRFEQALQSAIVADMEPGDAIFIPGLWWHHVEALSPTNLLINYWWQKAPNYLGSPLDAMLHAILALKQLPADQKQHWHTLFNHYVFDSQVPEYLPKDKRGVMDEIDENLARRIRARLINQLNR